jgi:AraC family transcriptional regulator of adaptative response / DNA-3-methyladenine glycosylase II
MRQHPGLRPPGAWEPFEPAVHAILTSHTGEANGRDLTAELVRRHGRAVPGLAQLGLTHLFPTPAALAGADLRQIGCKPEQAMAVAMFARAIARRTLRLDSATTLHGLIASLLAIPTLSLRTAHYIALRLGQADAYPGPAPADQRWRPFRASAATYLSLSAAGEITLAPVAASASP